MKVRVIAVLVEKKFKSTLMGIDDDDRDDDDGPDKIPTHHLGFCLLGFCPLGFILHTIMMMMIKYTVEHY